MTDNKTPIADLTLAEVISLTQAGLIGLKDGAPVYTDKADRAAKEVGGGGGAAVQLGKG